MIEFIRPRIFAFPDHKAGDQTVFRYEVHVYMRGGTCVGSGMTPGEALENCGALLGDNVLAREENESYEHHTAGKR